MGALDRIWRDLRYGLRTLWKDRRVAAVAILALALGIAATTVIFSVFYAVLISPFPYPNSERMVTFQIHDVTLPADNVRLGLTAPEFADFHEQTQNVFADAFAFHNLDVLYANKQGGSDILSGCWVTGDIFDALGIPPEAGRSVGPADAKPGAPPVFAMTDELWAKQFHRDPKILGSVLTLNGTPRTLVEIMPPRYVLDGCDVWIPTFVGHANIPMAAGTVYPAYFETTEHLRRGVNLKVANSAVDVVMRRLAQAYPTDFPKRFTVKVLTVAEDTTNGFQTMLFALMAAVLMLLLIACSNIASLLLARATAREKEIAIRTSLGASRWRLIRQLLVESFILSLAACAVGWVFTYFGTKEVAAKIPVQFPPSVSIELNFTVLLFALGVALLTTVLCGLAPAIHAVRGALQMHLNGTGRGMSAGSRHGRFRSALVIGEVALSVLLLAGAGLMIRSLLSLQHVSLGLDPSNILYADMAYPAGRYATPEQHRVFVQQVLTRVRALPGVKSATVSIGLPPFGYGGGEVIVPGTTHADVWQAEFDLCDEGYFQTMGIKLLSGRLLSAADVNEAQRVVVINETMARKYFKGENPIGESIGFKIINTANNQPDSTYYRVIGVVSDFRNQGLRQPPAPQGFLPYTIVGGLNGRGLLVRTAVAPMSLMKTVQREIWEVDPNIAFGDDSGTVLGDLQRFGYAQPEFYLAAMSIFAGIGLALVIVGVFSVMAYTVSLQTREIGVRMALGAQPRDIMRMVLGKGARLIVAGIVIGLLASAGLTRFLASQIWGVSATDPWTFAVVAILILVVGLAACAMPSRSAMRVDPIIALRYE
jgi:putative ABC transport system permease protein